MLLIGRIILGLGVGFANQCVPVYLSEVSPFAWRGACNLAFQLACTIAIWAAGMINWKASQYSQTEDGQGWRFSLGAACEGHRNSPWMKLAVYKDVLDANACTRMLLLDALESRLALATGDILSSGSGRMAWTAACKCSSSFAHFVMASMQNTCLKICGPVR